MSKRIFLTAIVLISYSNLSFANNNILVADAGHQGHHGHHTNNDAVGVPGKSSEVSRTVAVAASDDMKFNPNHIVVKKNETVKFVVTNKGQTDHEFVLGNAEELKKHADMMRSNPNMKHEENNQVTLKPGETKELVWKFTKAGEIDFACLLPAHFELGMKGKIKSE